MTEHAAGIDQFIEYWQSIRERTMRVAHLVPESRMEWAADVGAMSFGDLLRHLALVERWMFIETALGRPSRYLSHGREHAREKDDVLQLMRRLHAEGIEQLRALRRDDLERRVRTPAGAQVRAWKWLRAMVEHEVHHRGQLYLMLRLCGVVSPPIFGLTSEQLAQAGQPASGD